MGEEGMMGEGGVVGLGGMEVVRAVVMGVEGVVMGRVAGWEVEEMEREAVVVVDWVEGWAMEEWVVFVAAGMGCWEIGGKGAEVLTSKETVCRHHTHFLMSVQVWASMETRSKIEG